MQVVCRFVLGGPSMQAVIGLADVSLLPVSVSKMKRPVVNPTVVANATGGDRKDQHYQAIVGWHETCQFIVRKS
jgi:hypothetical protein